MPFHRVGRTGTGKGTRKEGCQRSRVWLAGIAMLLGAAPAPAFEALDGRFQAHGFFESQMRAISADYSEDWDMTQWYQVFNLELELDFLPDPVGPIDILQGYVRIEARYDCIYSRGCGMLRSVNAYGDRARSLPRRLSDSDDFPPGFGSQAVGLENPERRSGATTDPVGIERVNGFDILADEPGPDRVFGDPANPQLRNDDPFPYVFERFDDYRFTQIQAVGGGDDGQETRVLGPWLPENFVETNAGLADRVHPLDDRLASPVLQAAVFNLEFLDSGDAMAAQMAADNARGSGARWFRPIPQALPGRPGEGDAEPRGLYLPSAPLRETLDSLDSFNFNFRESERAWNRGSSQQDEKELKEAYLDIELFTARLWLRIGKQSIVWGKTELFRTTDQFNPQDIALASLPSLEESRIPLWAVRGVWSFWSVGPLQDVRLEMAFNFDQHESDDLGACGEPYTVNLVCELTFGGFAHGTAGVGIAGIDRPDDPWESLKGWELGARLEFRWDRFSFALIDFWGYDDRPYLDRLSTFERNVDPETGRPRVIGGRTGCETGAEPDCLKRGPRTFVPGDPFFEAGLEEAEDNALLYHHANQQVFNMICSTTIGFSELDATACAQTVFGSSNQPIPGLTVSQLLSGVIAGSPAANGLQSTVSGVLLPLVELSAGDGREDANPLLPDGSPCTDPIFSGGVGPDCGSGGAGPIATGLLTGGEDQSLGSRLTPEQEALWGCGPFWQVNCDDSGVDLMNTEASMIVQSFVSFDGTTPGWRTDDAAVAQPGTVGFQGGPVCTFGDLLRDDSQASAQAKLPGCRGPGDPGYDVTVDGDPNGVATVLPAAAGPPGLLQPQGTAGHPFTGQPWQSELSASSWNFMMIAVSQSTFSAEGSTQSVFDPGDPYRVGGCSFVQPQFCERVQSLFNVVGVQRNVVEAGGNGRFGRRTFTWHSGGEAVLRFQKRNVLGVSVDFAEDATKSNWSIEATWINDQKVTDNDVRDGIGEVDEFNLTISADRPTFINFLNANRTFFINTQWFIQYLGGYEGGMTVNGPWNVLGTLSIDTGYYQDRLLPSVTFVYDVQSVSGAVLPEVTYRYNDAFSVTVGAAVFMGREERVDMPLNPLSPSTNRVGPNAYKDATQNGLAPVRDRDEVFLVLRYTF